MTRFLPNSALLWIVTGIISLSGCQEEIAGPGVRMPLVPQQQLVALGGGNWVSVSVDKSNGAPAHTCGLTWWGAAYCWGSNHWGEAGNPEAGDGTPLPVAVAGGLTFASISAGAGPGGSHTCGVTMSGAAYCWGSNGHGELGNPAAGGGNPIPVPVAGGLTFALVSAGNNYTCGVTTSGAAYCWGDNASGQLGGGGVGGHGTQQPYPVEGGLTFSSVSAGTYHTCGVTTSGAVYCWGAGSNGQLGNAEPGSLVPVAVTGGLTFASVSASEMDYDGEAHTCGVTTAGAAYCWGSNAHGQLGNSAAGPATSQVPVAVAGGLIFSSLSAGAYYTCGVTTAGAGYCWGANGGVFGNGNAGGSSEPLASMTGLILASISAGTASGQTCGITTDGAAYCWGGNGNGELGNGSTDVSLVPVLVGPVEPPPEATPVGTNIELQPTDQSTGQPSQATIGFASVTGAGLTTVTSGTVGEGGAPPAPSNFQLGDPAAYYEIRTTAAFAGTITVCISYAGVDYPNPSLLKLLHYDNGNWVDATTSITTQTQVVCGTTSSLSPFLVAQAFYAFTGFFRPIENQDANGNYILNLARAGSAIPVKFSLGGDFGLSIFSSGYPKSQAITCTGGTIADGQETVAAGESSLSYGATTGQYSYIWKTDKSWTGCRQLTVKLNDGTEHKASFKF